MTIHLDATAQIAKSFAVKREKQADDSELVKASLKLADVFLCRDQLDELLGQPVGWSSGALYDEFGAPRARVTLALHRSDWTASGVIRHGEKSSDPRLTLKDAELGALALELTKLGATLACTLSWVADGDEVNDVSDMLGQLCGVRLVLTDGGQGDMFAPLQKLAAQDGIESVELQVGGKTIATFGGKVGETVSSAGEAMKLLQKGWKLVGAEPDFDLLSPDEKVRRGCWLNAARSCLKRGLIPAGENRYIAKRVA